MRGTTSVRLLSLVALLYVIEGFPMGVYADVWPVFLRRQDVSNTVIGLLSSLYLAWSVKVLWSPLVDRYHRDIVETGNESWRLRASASRADEPAINAAVRLSSARPRRIGRSPPEAHRRRAWPGPLAVDGA